MNKGNQIRFEKANLKHKNIIFRWLAEPHVQEFWDNSQAHKDDIVNFINGRKEPSDYFGGKFVYWMGFVDEVPFSLIMTIKEDHGEAREKIKSDYLSKTGSTYGIDFMIGEKEYLGKGLGIRTLSEFPEFFQKEIDNDADTFFIDPDVSNPRARHVYEKAGFKHVGEFVIDGQGVFRGHETHFMVKTLP
jgi:RimJ/RimL family protein N-acetyltransferase